MTLQDDFKPSTEIPVNFCDTDPTRLLYGKFLYMKPPNMSFNILKPQILANNI
jgi:hypothetical protein